MVTKAKERVRGMNAAIADGGVGVGEVKPGRSPLRPRQVIVTLVIAAVGATVGVISYNALTSKPVQFSGQVAPAHAYFLNFVNTGTVLTLNVAPGTKVTAGEVLATEDSSVAAANLAAAEAQVTADQATVAADQNPTATITTSTDNQLALTKAEAALQSAQNAESSDQSSSQKNIGAEQQIVNGDQNTYNTDSTNFNKNCTGQATPSSSCTTLQSQVSKDQTALNAAQSALTSMESDQTQQAGRDGNDVNQDQAVVTAAQARVSSASAPLTPATIDQAQSALATAEAQVATDKQLVQQASIVAPAPGVIADTGGAVGDLVGSDGVHNYTGPAEQSGTEAQQEPGFELFVPQTNSGSSANTNTPTFESLITEYSGPMSVIAQIPEANMTGVHTGQGATLSVGALNENVQGTVSQIMLDPARVPGSTYYDILISIQNPPAALLAGMNVDVTLN
jgi:multidrug efflux pump subunit AcrA (membrane-fusion protein)